ncbi:hypothetical protein NSTC745_02919 [Nostoc sp. DSM 114161]
MRQRTYESVSKNQRYSVSYANALVKATVYTQVIELPHPNPPLGKGREQDLFFPPIHRGD